MKGGEQAGEIDDIVLSAICTSSFAISIHITHTHTNIYSERETEKTHTCVFRLKGQIVVNTKTQIMDTKSDKIDADDITEGGRSKWICQLFN